MQVDETKMAFVPLAAALESLGVDPREVESLLADRAGGEAA